MKKLIITLALFTLYQTLAFAQWSWLEQASYLSAGMPIVSYKGIATDNNGNIYVCGDEQQTINPGCSGAIRFAKYAADGTLLWEQSYLSGNMSTCERFGNDIVVDEDHGRLTIGGKTSPGGAPLLAAFSAQTGSFLSSTLITGNGVVTALDIKNDKIFAVGNFTGTLNFGNGISLSGGGIFVARFSWDGTAQQAWRISATDLSNLRGYDLKVDDTENVYLTLVTKSTLTFHGNPTASYNYSGTDWHIVAVKLNPQFNLTNGWASKIGSAPNIVLQNTEHYPIALANSLGSVFIGGRFGITGISSFLRKISTTNGTNQASLTLQNKTIYDLSVADCGSVYVTGEFTGMGAGACYNLPVNMFLSKHNVTNCIQIWEEESNGACARGTGIAIGQYGNPVLCGSFEQLNTLGLGSFTISDNDGGAAFLASYDEPIACCTGVQNRCLDFQGTDDYVQAATSPISGSGDFTLEAWVFDASTGADPTCNDFRRIIGWGAGGFARVEIGTCGGILAVYADPGGSGPINSTLVGVRDGQWHHVAMVRSGVDLTVYLDCQEITHLTNANTLNVGGIFRVGRWSGGSAANEDWNGQIDEVRVWNIARTSSQICGDYQCELGGKEPGLVLYYPFNQGIGNGANPTVTSAIDQSLSGNNGALNSFTLNGGTSNWACPGAPLSGTCFPHCGKTDHQTFSTWIRVQDDLTTPRFDQTSNAFTLPSGHISFLGQFWSKVQDRFPAYLGKLTASGTLAGPVTSVSPTGIPATLDGGKFIQAKTSAGVADGYFGTMRVDRGTNGEINLVAVRVDNNSNILWMKELCTVSAASSETVKDIIQDTYGDFVLIGTVSEFPGNDLLLVAKVDFNGLWADLRTYETPYYNLDGQCIIEAQFVLPSGGPVPFASAYILGGNISSTTLGNQVFYLPLSASLNIPSSLGFNFIDPLPSNSKFPELTRMLKNSNGNLVLVGMTENNQLFFIEKTIDINIPNPVSKYFQIDINGPAERALSLSELPGNNYLLGGVAHLEPGGTSSGMTPGQGFLLKLNGNNGLTQWTNIYADAQHHGSAITSIEVQQDGGYLLSGRGYSIEGDSASGILDYLNYIDSWVARTGPNGELFDCDCVTLENAQTSNLTPTLSGGESWLTILNCSITNIASTRQEIIPELLVCDQYNPDTACIAIFTLIDQGCGNLQFFNNSLTSGNAIYQWNFNNEGNSNALNPSFTFTTLGTKNICLTVTDAACINTYCLTVQVTDICPPDNCFIKTNNCLDFDGINDRVTVPSPLTTTTLMNNFTVGCWFLNDRTSGGAFYRLFGWSSTDRFELGDQGGFLSFYSIATSTVISTANIRDGQWHYVVAIKSGTSVTVYLDGTPVPQLTNLNAGNFSALGTIFRIGDWGGSAATSNWQGRIDEFKIWNQALPASVLCNIDPIPQSVITQFSFDEGIAGGNNTGLTTALNNASGGANGTLSGPFNLSGNTSNWAALGVGPFLPCLPIPFVRLEGNADHNISGVTKVYESDIYSAGTEGIGSNNYPTFTRRRPDGSIVWRTKFDITGTISDFVRTDQGCFLLVGYNPGYSGNNKSFIAKVESNGVVVWVKLYETHSDREGFFRIIRSDNPAESNFPYIVCGYMKTGSGFRDDVVLYSINTNGQAGSLKKRIGKTDDDDEFGRTLVSWNGQHILGGNVLRSSENRAVLYTTNNQGTPQASNTVQYQDGTAIFDIKPASNQHLILAGSIANHGLLAKVSATGNTNNGGWAMEFPNIVSFHNIAINPANGDIFAVGRRVGSGNFRNAILKVRNDGTVLWEKYPDIPGELGYTQGFLTAYRFSNILYTDGRYGKPGYPSNENILAAMYDLEMSGNCPVAVGPVSKNSVTLTPSPFITDIVDINLPTPIAVQTGTPLVLDTINPCTEPCGCEFKNLAFSKRMFPGGFNTKVSCGNTPVTLPCPMPNTPVRFNGRLNCTGDCEFAGMSWQILNPAGIQVNTGSNNTNPAFSIHLTSSMLQTQGIYTIELIGKCGNDTCTCVVKFIMPQCPSTCDCTEPAFTKAVENGFNIIQFPDCNLRFTPKSLNDCDIVTWKLARLGDPTYTNFATSIGKQAVSYQFLNSGEYVVCMTVKRTPPPPAPVCEVASCWVIDVNCGLAFYDNANNRSDTLCDMTELLNGGFVDGAEAGGMAEEGAVWQWDDATGNPKVILDSDLPNPNYIRLEGNFGFQDILYQDSISNLNGRTRLFLKIRPIPGLVLPGTELVVRLSDQKQISVNCVGSCQEIARVEVPEMDSPIWLALTSYDSVTIQGKFLSIHLENPFDEDDLVLKSVVDVDNVCLEQFNFVSTQETDLVRALKLYPNPTTNTLILEWQETLPSDAQVILFDALGRVALDTRIPNGATRLEINLANQPSGFYFVQMQAKGIPFKMAKVVKMDK